MIMNDLAPGCQRAQIAACMGRGAGGKGAQRSGHSIGKGAKGKGKDPDSLRYFETNQQILQVAEDKTQFLSLLDQLSNDRVKLTSSSHIMNISTILHRGAKLRLSLPTHVVRFLGEAMNEVLSTLFEQIQT